MTAKTATPWEKTGFYRAHTPTGWAAYCKAYGVTRPATPDEALNQEAMTDE